MTWQIFDLGGSINFQTEYNIHLVMKSAILSLKVIKGNIIKVETENPFQSIYIRHSDVYAPVTAIPNDLRDLLNNMISNCLCGGDTTGSIE